MDSSSLPKFKYHPDPIATGSVEASDAVCPSCNRARGFVYVGPSYGEEDVDDLCPWCIADGSAHEKLDVEFADRAYIGGFDEFEKVPDAIVDEIAFRTPAFSTMQGEKWLTHCGDGAEFVGDEDLGGGETQYNFRCRACKKSLSYTDCD